MPISLQTQHLPVLDQPLADQPPMSVLVVDDQAIVCETLSSQLRRLGVAQVHSATSWQEALTLYTSHRPDLVFLDVCMPEHDGYWVAQQIRELDEGGWTPIIFLSALDGDEDLWRGIEAGGDDYLVKPVTPLVLYAKLRVMQRLMKMRKRLSDLAEEALQVNKKLHKLVERDGLTGLINRRGFDRLLHQSIRQAKRNGQPLTLMLIDIDHFKRYNDALGHLQGDTCLQHVGRLLREICHRPQDSAARYGGEEFALILPNTPKSGAMTFARACLQMLNSFKLYHPDSPVGPTVTISGGITSGISGEHTTPEELVMRADKALYIAKAKGRNQFFSLEMQASSND
jgi:diguanylate cyclase (GGDEF)-like protein